MVTPTVSSQSPDFRRFQIGEWIVEPELGRIIREGITTHVEPKAMEVLVYLAHRAGEVVSREELERNVWHGALIGYDAVTNTVIKLRKALDDDARHPRYIATVPKRGYRLLPEVSGHAEVTLTAIRSTGTTDQPTSTRTMPLLLAAVAFVAVAVVLVLATTTTYDGEPQHRHDDIVVRGGDIPTLVVLPFANLGDAEKQQPFIDGMTEQVTASLSKISGLRVIARNSAFAFAGVNLDPREVAEQLGVRYILHGSVSSSGETFRVTTKLVDAESGVHLWGEQFEGEMQELFGLQDRVTARTAEALSIRLTDDELQKLASRPTNNLGAYEDYLRGRVAYGGITEKENQLARSMYRRAIEKDPDFALAYAGLALSYIDDFRSGWAHDRQHAASKALKLAEQAVELDETLPQAHFAAGFVYLYAYAEHERAIGEAHRALALDPNYADAYALLSSAYYFSGDLEKTLVLDREAMRLNPASSFIYYVHLGRTQYLKGNYQKALDAFLIAAAKDYNFIPTHIWLAATYAMLGDQEEAEWAVEQLRTLEPEFSIDDWMSRRPYKNPQHRESLTKGLVEAGLR